MELGVSPNVAKGEETSLAGRTGSSDGAESISTTAQVRARRDVIEPCVAFAVQPRVEGAERDLPFESSKSFNNEIMPATICIDDQLGG
jgi:hypothetical protein